MTGYRTTHLYPCMAWCTSMLLNLHIKRFYFEIAVHVQDPLPDNKLLSVKLSTETNFALLRIPEH